MPRKIDRTVRDAKILRLLASSPHTTQELERRVSRGMNAILPALARKGLLKQCADHRWALPFFDETTLSQYPRIDPVMTTRQEGDGKALRHAHERPTRITVTENLSWWATTPRENFTSVAVAHEGRMRGSVENRLVAHRMLQ
jgi:hypothetical protein